MKLFGTFILAGLTALTLFASPVLAASVPHDILTPSATLDACVAPEPAITPAAALFVEAYADCDAVILDVAGICLRPVSADDDRLELPDIASRPLSCAPPEWRSPG